LTRRIRTLSKNAELVKHQRKTIMEAAVSVFAKKSYAEATMQEIAKKAGMAPGNIYRYIKSKTDILRLICLRSVESINDMNSLYKDLKTESETEKLINCLSFFYRNMDNEEWCNRHYFFNVGIRNFSKKDRRLLLGSQVEYTKFFEKIIIDGINAGEFDTDDPLLVAHHIIVVPHDWVLRRWFLKDHFTNDEYVTKQIKLILKMLGSKAELYHKKPAANY
jgi:AcrR family transcriptional regulator